MIRRNSDDLSDWIDRAREFYKPLGGEVTGRPAVIKFPSGAMGRTGHLKDENAYSKYQGHEYHKILIEELTQIPREKYYKMLLGSCRSTNPELKPQVFCTTNPGGPGHLWVKNRFVQHGAYNVYRDEKSGLKRVFIPGNVKDNPALSQDYISYLMSLDEKLQRMWLEGSWDEFDGQFFNEWDSNIHVVDPFDIPKHWKRYIGLDYGYSAPSAAVWAAVSESGDTYIYRELYQTGLTFEALRDELVKYSEGEEIQCGYFDPDLKRVSKGLGIYGDEILNDQSDIPWVPANNSRPNGWARVREYLRVRKDAQGNPYAWLKIFRTCKNTIATLPELVHDSVKMEDLDSDGEDHLADALRYFVMGRPKPATAPEKDRFAHLSGPEKEFWKEHHGEMSIDKEIDSYIDYFS